MKELLLALNLACGADALSTHIALARYPTARERLLPSQNPWVIDGITAGQAVVTSLGVRWLDRHKHPKLARVVGWTVVGVRASAVAWNVRQMGRARQ